MNFFIQFKKEQQSKYEVLSTLHNLQLQLLTINLIVLLRTLSATSLRS